MYLLPSRPRRTREELILVRQGQHVRRLKFGEYCPASLMNDFQCECKLMSTYIQ